MDMREALRQCIEAMKLVDFKDCDESEKLWHQHGQALANAERVLRDNQAPSLQAVGAVHEGWQLVPIEITDEMVNAADAHIDGLASITCIWDAMLSAAPQPAAEPSGDVEKYDDSKKDAERLIFAMQDIDGFGAVALDKYDYAMHFAHCNGRDEPTKEDELIGLRALIDAAITATKE